jgi:methionine transaminase
MPMILNSKLPHIGNTIFSTMSALAHQHNAINLGQGFADYQMHPKLCELVHINMQKGHNQYAPMPGVQSLREAIAHKVAQLYGATIDANEHITITPGGTYGIYTAITTIVEKGDEVIVIEPAYDSYVPNIILAGGVPVLISLQENTFEIDWEKVQNAINIKTKAIIINTPHNPTGKTIKSEEWDKLYNLIQDKNIFVISDEVYEHIVMDGQVHESILKQHQLWDRTFAVFSFGKVYHNTGWKIGYVIAPNTLTKEFRKIHQYLVFTCNTPVQYALAEFMQEPHHYLELPQFFQQKRDLFLESIKDIGFTLSKKAEGSFFQTLGYEQLSSKPDIDFCIELVDKYGVAAIPVSAFYQQGKDDKLIRFCFAKKEETLIEAVKRLASLKQQ